VVGRELEKKVLYSEMRNRSAGADSLTYSRELLSLGLDWEQLFLDILLLRFFFYQMLEVYRSKRARQACDTGWKPAEQYIHWPREQTPLTIVKHKRRVLWDMFPSTSPAENKGPLYIDPLGTTLPQ